MMELAGICREYVVGDETVHALDHVDLAIAAGEYVSIMGPSGSGKSTLLNVLGLLDRPTSGTYRLQGEDVSSLDDDALAAHRQRHIGFIFQFFHLIPRLTALENVELPLVLTGAAPRTRRERATRDPGVGGAQGPARPPARSALGRRAAARRDRARDHHAAELPARRRADGQPRHALRRRDHADPRAAEPRRHRAPGRHARSCDRRPRAPPPEAARRQDRRRRARGAEREAARRRR